MVQVTISLYIRQTPSPRYSIIPTTFYFEKLLTNRAFTSNLLKNTAFIYAIEGSTYRWRKCCCHSIIIKVIPI